MDSELLNRRATILTYLSPKFDKMQLVNVNLLQKNF